MMNRLNNPLYPLATQVDRAREALRVAKLYFELKPEWSTFVRDVMGVQGEIRKLFPSDEEFAQFEQTREYQEIEQLLLELRTSALAEAEPKPEPMRVVTIRLPKSLHRALQEEAHGLRVSMNKLCIARLIETINQDLISGLNLEPFLLEEAEADGTVAARQSEGPEDASARSRPRGGEESSDRKKKSRKRRSGGESDV